MRLLHTVKPNDNTGGARAETLAAAWLARRGLKVIARNYRVRGGEIDLICRDGRVLVFVEVRLRRRGDFGGAAASITERKRQRLVLAARHYLAGPAASHADAPCRFDAVLMDSLDEAGIDWIKDAFAADAV